MKPTVISFGTPKESASSNPITPTAIKPSVMGVSPMTAQEGKHSVNTPIKPSTLGSAPSSMGQKPQPTAPVGMGAPAPAHHVAPSVVPQTIAPSVAPVSQVKPVVIDNKPIHVENPSSMPGEQHKPLKVTYQELEQRYPNYPASVYHEAIKALSGVIPSALSVRSIMAFGDLQQKDAAQLIQDILTFQTNSAYITASQHASRMTGILARIIESVSKYKGDGFFKRIIGDTPQELWEKHGLELKDLMEQMGHLTSRLSMQFDELSDLRENAPEFDNRVQGASLAAAYCADTMPDFMPMFLDKTQSLQHQHLMLVTNTQQLDMMLKATAEWIQRIKDLQRISFPRVCSTMVQFVQNSHPTNQHESEMALKQMFQHLN